MLDGKVPVEEDNKGHLNFCSSHLEPEEYEDFSGSLCPP